MLQAACRYPQPLPRGGPATLALQVRVGDQLLSTAEPCLAMICIVGANRQCVQCYAAATVDERQNYICRPPPIASAGATGAEIGATPRSIMPWPRDSCVFTAGGSAGSRI